MNPVHQRPDESAAIPSTIYAMQKSSALIPDMMTNTQPCIREISYHDTSFSDREILILISALR